MEEDSRFDISGNENRKSSMSSSVFAEQDERSSIQYDETLMINYLSSEFVDQVQRKFQNLIISVEEVEKKLHINSDEKVQNLDEQNDEIEALVSIYGDDIHLEFSSNFSFKTFYISINMELEKPLLIKKQENKNKNKDENKNKNKKEKEKKVMIDNDLENSIQPSPLSPSSLPSTSASTSSPPSAHPFSSSHPLPSLPFSHPLKNELLQFEVEHLPPILLLCSLPSSYPSHHPPVFFLYCNWLNPRQLSTLIHELTSMHNQQAGSVILYNWIDWLSRECLHYLNIRECLVWEENTGSENADSKLSCLEPGSGTTGLKETVSNEAVLGKTGLGRTGLVGTGLDFKKTYSPLNLRFAAIKEWNERRKSEIFNHSIHTCMICLSEHLGTEFEKLSCDHTFCRICLQSFISSHVNEGSVTKLVCPEPRCKLPISYEVLNKCMSKIEFCRWENLMLQRTLDCMVDLVYCPRCSTAVLENEDNHALCPSCMFSFCGLCCEPWHPTRACLSAEAKLRVLQERQKGNKELNNELIKKEKQLMNEVLNLKFVTNFSKLCPTCHMAIQKEEGCNKMTCINCNTYFCYLCGKKIDGYDHFGKQCVLFDLDELRAQEELMGQELGVQVRGMFVEAAIQQWPERRTVCPNCKQPNFKEQNNNHILCWACRRHFCALCKKIVYNSAEHFGPGRCKQHSA